MDSTEEARSSGSAMDGTPEARRKEMLDQILVMVTKMASDLEACNAAFRTAPLAFVADSDSSGREVDATTGIGYNSTPATLHSLASASASKSKAADKSLADHDPSTDPASNQVLGLPIGKHIFCDKAFFCGCGFYGAQDTLCDDAGRYYFRDCYIEGSTDFVFDNARSLYRDCELHSTAQRFSSVAAHGWHDPCERSGFAFVNSRVTGTGRLYVGRASQYSRFVYAYTYFNSVIAPGGWDDWDHTSNLMTAAAASLTSSPTSAPSQDTDLGFQFGVTELLIASPTRCSTLSLYRYACIPVSIALSSAPSTAFPASTLPQEDNTNIGNGRGCRQPKPPWLLGTEVFRSWSRKMHLISGFLLEVSPWFRDYMKWVQWQPSMTPPVQLQKASRGTDLQLLPCLFIVCTGAEAKQPRFLLVLIFDFCYVELPIVHSNFQSYILVFEVVSGKPVALHFICRNGGKFLLQPWPPPDPFLALGD